jgi:hypothetical protein
VANVKVPAVFQVEFKATSKIPFVETVRAEMVPDPPKLPPVLTTTPPAVPFTVRDPPLTVERELEAIDPFVATSKDPELMVVPPV